MSKRNPTVVERLIRVLARGVCRALEYECDEGACSDTITDECIVRTVRETIEDAERSEDKVLVPFLSVERPECIAAMSAARWMVIEKLHAMHDAF